MFVASTTTTATDIPHSSSKEETLAGARVKFKSGTKSSSRYVPYAAIRWVEN